MYAAPPRLRADRPNRLVEVGEAPGIVTDATFLPGGGGVVMRTYSQAYLADVPVVAAGDVVGPARAGPGRGRRARPDGLLLSTEGARSQVLPVPLPAEAGATDLRGTAWTALRWLATARGLPL